MLYRLFRPLLFLLPPETAHSLAMKGLTWAVQLGLFRWKPPILRPVTLFGLTFPNSIGLAAGFDKNAAYLDTLSALGFGFIEVGTVTPQPQNGNPLPRLFRIPQRQALINRMGFNNEGLDRLIHNIQQAHYKGILGINIGKNATTPIEHALDDYLIGLRKTYPYASYITINISSPNTQNLRSLQYGEALTTLLEGLTTERSRLHKETGRFVPLLLKVAPDLTEEEIIAISHTLLATPIEGLIVSNTTLSRDGVEGLPNASEAGGLSGEPLQAKSTQALALFKAHLQDTLPIIGVGGIMDCKSAHAKKAAGASLLQIYTGLIYKGPRLIRDLAAHF